MTADSSPDGEVMRSMHAEGRDCYNVFRFLPSQTEIAQIRFNQLFLWTAGSPSEAGDTKRNNSSGPNMAPEYCIFGGQLIATRSCLVGSIVLHIDNIYLFILR